MFIHECQEGMRVKAVSSYDSKDSIIGKLGTIRRVRDDIVLVEFDEDIGGHSDGGIKNGHAWNIKPECLVPASKDGKTPVVQYILQYLRDEDPFEVFFDLESAKARIAKLVDTDRYVKRDSFVLYHVDSVQKVSVSTVVSLEEPKKATRRGRPRKNSEQ